MNSGYWQDKAPPLPGTTSGSNGKRVPVDEHEFRHFSKNGFSGPSDVNHYLNQDHQQQNAPYTKPPTNVLII